MLNKWRAPLPASRVRGGCPRHAPPPAEPPCCRAPCARDRPLAVGVCVWRCRASPLSLPVLTWGGRSQLLRALPSSRLVQAAEAAGHRALRHRGSAVGGPVRGRVVVPARRRSGTCGSWTRFGGRGGPQGSFPVEPVQSAAPRLWASSFLLAPSSEHNPRQNCHYSDLRG